MKKKIIGVIMVLSIAVIAALNVNVNNSANPKTGLFENIQALAQTGGFLNGEFYASPNAVNATVKMGWAYDKNGSSVYVQLGCQQSLSGTCKLSASLEWRWNF